jgi:hypothetical protein
MSVLSLAMSRLRLLKIRKSAECVERGKRWWAVLEEILDFACLVQAALEDIIAIAFRVQIQAEHARPAQMKMKKWGIDTSKIQRVKLQPSARCALYVVA